jgi:DnaJ-class molecular chaperone
MTPTKEPCTYCKGAGEVGGSECPYCAGKGFLWLEKTDPAKHTPPLRETLDMPAFPSFGNNKGMSLRDYFAAQVLRAVYTDVSNHTDIEDELDFEAIARDAYAAADAMLKERTC